MAEEVTIRVNAEVGDATRNMERFRHEMQQTERQVDKTVDSAERVGQQMSSTASQFSDISRSLGTISPTLGRITKSVNDLSRAWAKLGLTIKRNKAAGTDITDMGNSIGTANGTIKGSGMGRLGKAAGILSIAAVGASLFNAMTGSGSKLAAIDKLNTLGSPDLLGNIDGNVKKVTQNIGEIGGNVASILATMTAGLTLRNAWGSTDSNGLPTPDPVVATFQDIYEGWANFIVEATTDTNKLSRLITDRYGVAFESIFNTFKRNAGQAWADFESAGNAILAGITDTLAQDGAMIGSWFNGVGEGIVDFFAEIGDSASMIGATIGSWFNGVGNGMTDLFATINGYAQSIGINIGGWFEQASVSLGGISKTVQDVGDGIGSWFNGVGNGIGDIFKGIGDWATGIGDTISGWFNNIPEEIAVDVIINPQLKTQEKKTNTSYPSGRSASGEEFDVEAWTKQTYGAENEGITWWPSQKGVYNGVQFTKPQWAIDEEKAAQQGSNRSWSDKTATVSGGLLGAFSMGTGYSDVALNMTNGELLSDYGELTAAMLGLASGGLLTKTLAGSADDLLKALGTALGFAEGGVFMPNRPQLAILGDNRAEPEVAAPYSMIVNAVREAIGGTSTNTVAPSSSKTPIQLTLNGKVIARAIYDDMESERKRRNGSMVT